MTEPSRPRRPGVIARETWARRVSEAHRTRLRTYRDRGMAWRLLTPAVFFGAGTLFVASAVSSDGTDLRAGRYGDLSSVVSQATEEVDELRERRNALAEEVERLTANLGDTGVLQAQRKVEELTVPAGLAAMHGPGLTVELDDAPPEAFERAETDPELHPNSLVVHQQDIQAVVNAMWAGGAEAMTIQGQRVISTTGIKCVGNTVVLHDVPYSPPYVITAVGNPSSMLAAINSNHYIDTYLDYVATYDLGWDVRPEAEAEVPAYEGSLQLDHARPPRQADVESRSDDT